MISSFTVISLNTESGGRPGFHRAFVALVAEQAPDVIALQEVHQAHDATVPVLYTPKNPGKREHPIRLRLYNELSDQLITDYVPFFAFHLAGLHDLEACALPVSYGQALFVHRRCLVSFSRSDFVYGIPNQFNTEATGGTPAGKVALGVNLTVPTGQKIVLTNVHGFWSQKGKVDLAERFVQNHGIDNHLKRLLFQGDTKHVLCVGDLNYRSDMRALEDLRSKLVFGQSGGVVLNHQFGSKRTRTDHYLNWEKEPEADYLIASSVLAECAESLDTMFDFPSDHAPLVARFWFKNNGIT